MNKQIIHGDCLEVLSKLPKVKMIFADPPDNLKVKYDGYVDYRADYYEWLYSVIEAALSKCEIFWLSHHSKHDIAIKQHLLHLDKSWGIRPFIWRFTFGQHRKTDCGYGYRGLLRIRKKGAIIYPDAILEPSARIAKYNDKRGNPDGRVPDDCWEFPRVCGTFKERRKWHPNQHPEALLRRIVQFSCKPGDKVSDLFGGTGSMLRVWPNTTVIEISEKYCREMSRESGVPITNARLWVA